MGKQLGLITEVRIAGYRVAKRGSRLTTVLAGRISVDTPFTLSGRLRPGQTLTAAGTFTPADATATYQWYRAGKPIAGATRATYRVVGDDLGQHLAVRVTLAKPQWQGASTYAGATSKVREPAKMVVHTRGTKGGAVVRSKLKNVDVPSVPTSCAPTSWADASVLRSTMSRGEAAATVSRRRWAADMGAPHCAAGAPPYAKPCGDWKPGPSVRDAAARSTGLTRRREGAKIFSFGSSLGRGRQLGRSAGPRVRH